MASKASWDTLTHSGKTLKRARAGNTVLACLTPCIQRSMATETEFSVDQIRSQVEKFLPEATSSPFYDPKAQVLTTVHSFPSMEPTQFEYYPSNQLFLPFRRDILHRAVIFEGDKTRQGTASTKWRYEVHGGLRKLRPQKGTGAARLGDRKSPMLKGGGVAFGPKPRDFSTDLPRKIYDLAWRTALSYRYRRGQLIVVEDKMDLDEPSVGLLRHIFDAHGWTGGSGTPMVVTKKHRRNLFHALEQSGRNGQAKTQDDVDVKDLLSMSRVVIERRALKSILQTHSSDLDHKIARA
ncbi:MAG: 54S ribosomal protein, mitochondrial [Vezdaea aestivalis]|nr:MAG: 54S ribosomal protein, mitochondrial [Vezdaea aestivalis]